MQGQVLRVYRMDYPDYVFYDTLAASRQHYGHRLPNHQLQTVAAACGYDLTNHHHALADTEACDVLFYFGNVFRRSSDRYSGQSVRPVTE